MVRDGLMTNELADGPRRRPRIGEHREVRPFYAGEPSQGPQAQDLGGIAPRHDAVSGGGDVEHRLPTAFEQRAGVDACDRSQTLGDDAGRYALPGLRLGAPQRIAARPEEP